MRTIVATVFVMSALEILAAPPDKQAPAPPSNLVAAGITISGFTVSWTASTDNIGVTGYEVFLNGVTQNTVTTNSKVFSGLASGTTYTVTVRARDAAGNWSGLSSPLSVPTPADTVAPSAPTALVSSNITTSGFTLTWAAATDNVGVTGYEVFLGGTSQGVTTTTSKVFTGLSAGASYSVTVRARDAAANWSAQSSALVVVTLTDSAPPTMPANLVASGILATGFTVTWSASTDNVGTTGYEVLLNGITQGTVGVTSKAITGLQPATAYSVAVRARDAAGNWSALSTILSVSTLSDTNSPSVPTGLSSSAVSSSGFTLSWSPSSDNLGVTGYEVFLGGVSQGTTSTTSKDVGGLQPSTTYSVTVRARDAAGNWSAQSTALSVTTSALPALTFAISASEGNVALAKSDGSVWLWGQSFGLSPTKIAGVATAKSVAAGGFHVLILQQDGTVLGYGTNTYGQMADGTATTPISRFTGIMSVAAGRQHSLAIKADGTLYGWGLNQNGQVGNGKITTVTSPTKLNQVSGITKIAAGSNHSLALKSDGTVLAWGANAHGEVGNGTTTDQLAPMVVSGLTGVVAIAAGGSHSLALKSDGTVWAWGSNASGQLGDGTFINRTRPVQVTGLTGATAISAALLHSIAQKSDGTIWAWGSNSYRQLGDGTSATKPTAVRATILSSALKTVAGGYATYAVLSDGTIRSWGSSLNGALGDGGSATSILPFDDVIQLVARNYDLFVLRRNGTVWSWGRNENGELGDGTIEPSIDARQIPGLSNIKRIEPGIALANDGTVFTWGPNDKGQLGDGTVTSRFTAAAVPGLSAVTSIASGSAHHAIVRSDGTVWTWGDNSDGALGDGTSIRRNSPIQVPGLYNISAIYSGGSNNYAVRPDGTVWSWGGDWWATTVNTNRIEYSPVLTSLSNIASVSYSDQALFLTKAGEVYACGFDNLGVGPWYGSPTPLLMPEMHNVVEVSVTTAGETARASDGTVWRVNKSGSGATIDVVTGISDPGSIKSVSGVGVVYQNGRVVLWNPPTPLRVAGFLNLASQVADLRVTGSASDTDGDGLSDAWELEQFGNLSHTAAADDDADGLTNIQEFLRSTNPRAADSDGDGLPDTADLAPADPFNGAPPTMTILGGNNQRTEVDQFNSAPLDVAVWRGDGFGPISGTPVKFSVTSGGGLLGKDRSGISVGTTVTQTTDIDGTAQVYYKQPSTAGVQSQIVATAGTSQVTFASLSALAGDFDGDGLVDTWEQQFLGTLDFTGSDDPGGVGRTLQQSQQDGKNPWPLADITSGLQVWYQASLGVARDSGGKVTRWTDLSGRGAHIAAATELDQPVWISSGSGGQGAVQFGGTQKLMSSAPIDVSGAAVDLTVVAVIKPTAGQTVGAEVFTFGGSVFPGYGLVAESPTRFGLRWYDGSGVPQRSPSVAMTTGSAQIVTVIKAAGVASAFRNGVAAGLVSAPPLVTPVVAKLAMGQQLSAQVAEVFVYNRALDTAERTLLESTLSARYAIAVGTAPDADGDGLSDAEEDLMGTNKFQPDHPDVQLVVTTPAKRTLTP
jgi:alpha-tubulin suppressor-like RCC1 family protein/chitodextrinase